MRLLNTREIIGKAVVVRCPTSHYHGCVGYVTSCWMDEDLGFELLFDVILHREFVFKDPKGVEKKIIVSIKIDLACDELELTNANFGNVRGEASTSNVSRFH